MKKKLFIIAIVLLIFVSIVFFSGKKGSNNDKPIDIKVGALVGPSGISMLDIFANPPKFSEDVTFSSEIVASPDLMVSKLLSNEINIAPLPVNLAANLYNKSKDLKVVSITGYGVLYLVSKNPIKSWEDLENKEIYTLGKGATPDIMLSYLLDKNKMTDKVNVNFSMSPAEIAQSLLADKIEYAMVPEPFLTTILTKSEDIKVQMDIQKEYEKINGTSYPITCLVVKNDLLEKNPKAVEKFLKSYENSMNKLIETPHLAIELVEKVNYKTPGIIVAKSIPRCNFTFIRMDEGKNIISDFLKIFFDFNPKTIGGNMPDDNFYYFNK